MAGGRGGAAWHSSSRAVGFCRALQSHGGPGCSHGLQVAADTGTAVPLCCSGRGAAGEAAERGGAAHGVERGRAAEPRLAKQHSAFGESQRVPGEWVPSWDAGCPPCTPSPALHLPTQIVFEITSRMWPMDGTVALDDIEYSATGGCDSNLEAPGKGVGHPQQQYHTFFVTVVPANLAASFFLCSEVFQQLCGRSGGRPAAGCHCAGTGGSWWPVLAEEESAGEQDGHGEQHSPGLRQHHFSRCKQQPWCWAVCRTLLLAQLPPAAPKQCFLKAQQIPEGAQWAHGLPTRQRGAKGSAPYLSTGK